VIADPEPVVSTSVVCGVPEAGEADQSAGGDFAASLVDHELVNFSIVG
jgi:hypothetical protein